MTLSAPRIWWFYDSVLEIEALVTPKYPQAAKRHTYCLAKGKPPWPGLDSQKYFTAMSLAEQHVIAEHRQMNDNIIVWPLIFSSSLEISGSHFGQRKGASRMLKTKSSHFVMPQKRTEAERFKPNAHTIQNHRLRPGKNLKPAPTINCCWVSWQCCIMTSVFTKGLVFFCAKKLVFPVAQWMCIANPLSPSLS